MHEQLSFAKKLTVGSLLLHALVLLIFASISFSNYLPLLGSPLEGVGFTPTAYFGVMGVMAIWLSGRHYLRTVRKRNLLIWAALHIFGSLYILFTILQFSSLHASPSPPDFLPLLISLVLYSIPPVLVIVSASMEWT